MTLYQLFWCGTGSGRLQQSDPVRQKLSVSAQQVRTIGDYENFQRLFSEPHQFNAAPATMAYECKIQHIYVHLDAALASARKVMGLLHCCQVPGRFDCWFSKKNSAKSKNILQFFK
jgi:hypothetical protein